MPLPPPELAVGAFAGQYAPQAPEKRDTGVILGGRLRARWSERWGVEAGATWKPVGWDLQSELVAFVGDPSADVVVLAGLGGGWETGLQLAFGQAGFGVDVGLFPVLDIRVDVRLRILTNLEGAFLFAVGPQLHTRRVYDADDDGVLDRVDRCRAEAEDLDEFDDTDGCPDLDDDRDQVPDAGDGCPRVPEDLDGFLDGDGCPEPDNDADGILDARDACSMVPEDFDGYQDVDGCADLDNDADGVPDSADGCPNMEEDADGFEDPDGCPDPDNDADGVGDPFDGAPDLPETRNYFEDTDGVPDALPPVLARFVGPVPRFRFAGTKLTERGRDAVEQLAAVLMTYPQVRIAITVTDPDAERADQRALTIAARLVEQGVVAERIEPAGAQGPSGVVISLVP